MSTFHCNDVRFFFALQGEAGTAGFPGFKGEKVSNLKKNQEIRVGGFNSRRESHREYLLSRLQNGAF